MTSENFPVLTEVLIPGQLPSIVRRQDPEIVRPVQSRDGEWEVLERDVREAVLKGLQSRIDMVLEQRLKDTVSALLAQVLAEMTAEIRTSLHDTVREVVSRAVTQEVARVRATRIR